MRVHLTSAEPKDSAYFIKELAQIRADAKSCDLKSVMEERFTVRFINMLDDGLLEKLQEHPDVRRNLARLFTSPNDLVSTFLSRCILGATSRAMCSRQKPAVVRYQLGLRIEGVREFAQLDAVKRAYIGLKAEFLYAAKKVARLDQVAVA